MENQEVEAQDSVTENTKTTADVFKIRDDIKKIEAKVEDLKADGEELYSDAIAALEAKREALEDDAKKIVQEAENELKPVFAQFKIAERTFTQKYGQAAAHAVEILLLAVIAGKLLGAV